RPDDPPPPNWDTTPEAPKKVTAPTPPLPPFDGSILIRSPAVLAPNQDLTTQLNSQSSTPGIVRLAMPDGVQLIRAEPPARLWGRHLEWDVQAGSITLAATFRLFRGTSVELDAELADNSGRTANAHQSVRVGVVRLDMRVTGPAAASVGLPVTYDVRIAN